MTETNNGLPEQSDAIDLDDVEAHGLREVAAAASIGAAVIGAGGAAFAASASGSAPVPRTPAIVQQLSHDAQQTAGHATGGASAIAGDATADARTLAGHTLTDAHQVADPTVHTASQDVSTIANDATALAHDVSAVAAHTASSEIDAATHAARGAVGTATDTAGRATKTADMLERSVLRIANATVNAVGRGWDLSFDVLGANVGGDGNMLKPTGRVYVTDANGNTLATTKIGHGKATLHLDAIGQDKKLTIHYSGDASFASTTLQWQPPVGF
jgi:hypothetical protein